MIREWLTSAVEERAAAIVLRGDSVLLVRRVESGREYFTLPGGLVGGGETAEMACLRELREQTGLRGEIDEALWVLDDRGRTERYFLIGPVTGMARLGGPAAPDDDRRELVWTAVHDLGGIDLRPTVIRDQLAAVV